MNLLVITFVLTLLCTSVQCVNERHKLFFLQKSSEEDNESLLVVTWKENQNEISVQCEKFTDKDQIKEVLSSNDAHIHKASEEEIQSLLRDCKEFISPRRRPQYDEETNDIGTEMTMGANDADRTTAATNAITPGYDGMNVIFPGTKWCGAGDRAKSYDDLGPHQETDRCCRAHDLCNDTLASGETRNNFTNKSLFTSLSCKCDNDFYNCLDCVNSFTSNTVGNVYFNILRRGCYEEDYPERCKKTFLKLKCVEYERDMNAAKVYQWVPAKRYLKYYEREGRKNSPQESPSPCRS